MNVADANGRLAALADQIEAHRWIAADAAAEAAEASIRHIAKAEAAAGSRGSASTAKEKATQPQGYCKRVSVKRDLISGSGSEGEFEANRIALINATNAFL